MLRKKYGTIERAVKDELMEEKMARWEHYLVWILLAWLLVMGFLFLWTQNYCEMLMLDAMMREQGMNSALWFRVMVW